MLPSGLSDSYSSGRGTGSHVLRYRSPADGIKTGSVFRTMSCRMFRLPKGFGQTITFPYEVYTRPYVAGEIDVTANQNTHSLTHTYTHTHTHTHSVLDVY